MQKIILKTIIDNYTKEKEEIIKNVLLNEYNIKKYKVKYTKNGKPYIVGNKVYFSISNDKDLLLIVFDNKPVGADIQFYRKVNNEINKLLMINETDNNKIIDIFSKKEAIIKLLDEKLSNINNIKINEYDVKTIHENDYVIAIAHYK